MNDRFRCIPGLAWYVGRQNDDNSVEFTPEYLCELPVHVVERFRYAGHLAALASAGQTLTVLYYVDPMYRHVYAQPHPDSPAFHMVDWGVGRPAPRGFEVARDFARSVFRRHDAGSTGDHRAWWREYAEGKRPHLPPPPSDIPSDPLKAYQGSGWKDFQDWLVTPPKKKEKARGHKKVTAK